MVKQNIIVKWFETHPKTFSWFATVVSFAGLILLIISARKESVRHIREIKAEEDNIINEDSISFVRRMNKESYEINEINTYGTIFVFLGFFLQQVYNIAFRMKPMK